MPKDLEKIDGQKHVVKHLRYRTYWTNYYDSESRKSLQRSTGLSIDSVRPSTAATKAQEMYNDWLEELKREKEEVKRKEETEQTGLPKPKDEMLFDDICVEILGNKRAGKRQKSYLAARNQLRHLMRYFRGRTLVSINKTDWEKYVTFCRTPGPLDSKKPLGDKMNVERNLNDDHKFMVMVMLNAYHKGIVAIPWGTKVIARPDEDDEPGRELTKDEIHRLFTRQAEKENTWWETEKARWAAGKLPDIREPRLLFQMELGLKYGWRLHTELLGLKKEYLRPDRNSIVFPREVTKTKKSREVAVAPEDMRKIVVVGERRPESPFIFPQWRNLLKPQADNKTAWYALCEELGINARWNDWRHTCATWLVRAGLSEKIIVETMGHSKKVLRRVYTHLGLEDRRQTVSAMQSHPQFLLSVPALPAGKVEDDG